MDKHTVFSLALRFNSRLREEATLSCFNSFTSSHSFNSRLREEATSASRACQL